MSKSRTSLSNIIIYFCIFVVVASLTICFILQKFWLGSEKAEQKITLNKVDLYNPDEGKVRDFNLLDNNKVLLYVAEKPNGHKINATLHFLNIETSEKKKIISISESDSRIYKLEATEGGIVLMLNSNLSQIAYYNYNTNSAENLEINDSLKLIGKNYFESKVDIREEIKKEMYPKCEALVNEAEKVTSIKISKYLPYKVIYLLIMKDGTKKVLIDEQCIPLDNDYEKLIEKYKDKFTFDIAKESKQYNHYGAGEPQIFQSPEHDFEMKSVFYLCFDTCNRAANHIYWKDKYYFARADTDFKEPEFDFKGSPVLLMNEELFTLQ